MAQSVGIGTQTPHASAVLAIWSTTKGLLNPRMTENQRRQNCHPSHCPADLTNRCNACLLLQCGTPEGPKWYRLADDNNWKLTGNNDVDSATHFLGTINKSPVYFKARNTCAGQLDSGKATHFGYKAGWKAPNIYNTAIGTEALSAPSEAFGNTAVATFAVYSNRAGDRNAAVDTSVLLSNISGHHNTCIVFFPCCEMFQEATIQLRVHLRLTSTIQER
jgi:hypothetical protein